MIWGVFNLAEEVSSRGGEAEMVRRMLWELIKKDADDATPG